MLVDLKSSLTHYNTPQHTATRCNTLQHIATHCNTLQHTGREAMLMDLKSFVLSLSNSFQPMEVL